MLKNLGSSLENQAKHEEAECIVQVLSMLRKGHFNRRGSARSMFKELVKDATPEEALGMRSWVPDDDDEAAEALAMSKANAAATQNSGLSSRVMKWTRKIPKLVLGSDASKLAHMLEHDVLNWGLDMNELHRLSGGHAIVAFGWALIERHGLRAKLDLRTDAVLELLTAVERGYNDVPYHNAIHGADVTHAMHWLLCSDALTPLVQDNPLLLFTALVAALTHDLGHDGYNNNFHINSNSELAVRASYAAPLERHHLASAFALLARPGSPILGFALAERKQLQTWMRELVLATDFGVHMDIISEFKAMLDMRLVVGAASEAGESGAASERLPVERFEADEKVLCLKMAIKTSDLGYLTKGHDSCLVWTERVLKEFYTQGDEEKRLGLPVSFGCDRETVDLPQLQLGFYQFMVQPLYVAMDLLVPMESQTASLDAMRSHWQQQKEAQEKGVQ